MCRFCTLGALLVLTALPVMAQDSGALAPFPEDELSAPPLSSKIWDDFSLPNLSSKGHRFLGYATVTLGGTAFAIRSLAPGSSAGSPSAHEVLSRSGALAAGTTVLAGVVAHWGQLSFEGELLTWHNLHAVSAALGSSLMVTGTLVGGGDLGSGLGLAGTLLMGLAIVLEG